MAIHQQGEPTPAPKKLSIFQKEDGSFEVYYYGQLIEPSDDGLVHIVDDGKDCVIVTTPMEFISAKEKGLVLKTNREDNTFYLEDSESGKILHINPMEAGGLLHILPYE